MTKLFVQSLPRVAPSCVCFNPGNWRQLAICTPKELTVWNVEQNNTAFIMKKQSVPTCCALLQFVLVAEIFFRSLCVELYVTNLFFKQTEDNHNLMNHRSQVLKMCYIIWCFYLQIRTYRWFDIFVSHHAPILEHLLCNLLTNYHHLQILVCCQMLLGLSFMCWDQDLVFFVMSESVVKLLSAL